MTCTALTWFSTPLYANPEGGVVVGGAATITAADKIMTVEQATERAAINWASFNLAADETVKFIQPGTSSVMLNRVTGSDPSAILGRIDANGKIILLNRNGILFGKDSRIDVGSLVASSADMETEAFMTGGALLHLSIPGTPSAQIINHGQITARDAGLVGLVAPQVENSGTINARLGRIQIGAGDTATLDLYGDNLIESRGDRQRLAADAHSSGLGAGRWRDCSAQCCCWSQHGEFSDRRIWDGRGPGRRGPQRSYCDVCTGGECCGRKHRGR